MTKITLLNGARAHEPQIDGYSRAIADALGAEGAHVHAYTLRDHKLAYCVGCFRCWTDTPGECIADDINRDIAADVITSDVVVFVTPVVFGGVSSELKRMQDHLIPLISPFFRSLHGETHHHKRYDHYPAMIGIGLQSTDNPTQAAMFHDLIERQAVNFGDCPRASAVWPLALPCDEVPANVKPLLASVLEVV
jgi:multimeric flavodoxin WrbA